MADNMQRVGLVFDADGTANFKKTLTEVNGSLQQNRNEFKLAQQQWDSSTKASEKLRTTQSYLTKQYEDSSRKVDTLTTELNELESAEVRDEKAIQKKKNALASAQLSMNSYSKGLDEVNVKLKKGTADIEEYAKKIDAFGKKTQDVGKGLTTGLSLPLVGIATGALMAWSKIDDAYDGIILKTGATGASAEALQNSFDNIYGAMPEESKAVSDAIGEVNTRFGLTGESLESMSTYMLKYAKITGTDVNEAVKQASFLQGNWNLTNKETEQALGLVAKKAQETGISTDILMNSVNKNSAVFKEMGLGVVESTTLLAQFERAGLDSDQMLVGMKKAAGNYAKEGKSMSAGLTDLISRLQDTTTYQDAYAEATTLFGAKNALSFATSAKEGRISLENLSSDLSSYGAVVDETYTAILDPMDKATITQHNLEQAGKVLGESIQNVLAPIFVTLSEILMNVANWFASLDSSIQTAIVIIGGLLIVLGPVLVVLGMIISSIGTVTAFFAPLIAGIMGAGTAFTSFGAILTVITSPISIILAVLALLIGAFVQLWTSNEAFRLSIETACLSIQEVFVALWENILSPIFTTLMEVFTNVWNNGIKPLWDVWVQFVGDITIKMLALWESIKPIVMWFIETFGPILTGIFDLVANVFGNTVTMILNMAGTLLSTIGTIIGGVIDVFRGIIDFIVNVFTGNWSGAWNSIVGIFSSIFNTMVGIAKTPINLIIDLVNGMIGAVESGLNWVIKGINKLSFTVPGWVPFIGGEDFGFDLGLVSFARLPKLAKGGDLLKGTAMVGEAGPELLTQQGNKTTVSPLTRGGGATPVDIIDYDKLATTLIKVIKNLTISLDDEKIGEVIDNRLIKAVA